MSIATIEAQAEAEYAQLLLAAAEAVNYGWNKPEAEELLTVMREAVATITRCAERMQDCKPQARFAYSAHITKAKRKLAWAETDLRRYTPK